MRKLDTFLDQEVSIDLLLKEHGMETTNGVRAPIVEEFNECNYQEPEYLPVTAANGNASVKDFQSRWEGYFGSRTIRDRIYVLWYTG